LSYAPRQGEYKAPDEICPIRCKNQKSVCNGTCYIVILTCPPEVNSVRGMGLDPDRDKRFL